MLIKYLIIFSMQCNVPRDTETLASARMSPAGGQHWRGGGQGSPGSGSRLLTSPPSTAHICMQLTTQDPLSSATSATTTFIFRDETNVFYSNFLEQFRIFKMSYDMSMIHNIISFKVSIYVE